MSEIIVKVPAFYLHCLKLDPRAQLPKRAEGSVGYDLWPLSPGTVFSGQAVEIPLGFAAEFPPGYAAVVDDKSGPGFKGIMHLAGLLDPNFRNEWKLKIYNSGQLPFGYRPEKSICQVYFPLVAPETDAEWVAKLSETTRKGGWGSTGH